MVQSVHIQTKSPRQVAQTVAEATQSKIGKVKSTLVEDLRFINPKILERYPVWQDIDDVLEVNLLRRSREIDGIRTSVHIADLKEGGTKLFPFHKASKEQEFIHLPKGVQEPWSEYQRRVALTPFFPETPNIVDNRRGALFAKEPTITTHEVVTPFLETIGTKRQSYREILDFIAWRTYAYGMVAVFADFREIPEEVKARLDRGEEISQEEADEKRLNQPVLGVFNERQIYDFSFNRKDGRMDWIKLRTTFVDRTGWRGEGDKVEVFRIIDRSNVNVFEVRETSEGARVTDTQILSHGAINSSGDPEVPVVLIRPFTGTDEIGQSPIQLSVDADLTAARLLSDITWNLYVHGCPIVIFETNDTSGERAASLEWGTTRYVQLMLGNQHAGTESEDMRYLQLDAEGTRLLIEMHQKMVEKANELANRTSPQSATDPVAMSGIAKQWDFKTGEEKALNEHVHALQMASDEVLKLVSRLLSTKKVVKVDIPQLEKEVQTSFDPSFEIGDPMFNLDTNERVIDLAKKHKLRKLMTSGLRRVPDSLHNLKGEERSNILTEMDELEDQGISDPPVIPPPAAASREDEQDEDKSAGNEGDE